MAKPDLDLATRGASYKAQKAEKWVFWPFLRDFKAVRTPYRCSRTPMSIKSYPGRAEALALDFCSPQVYAIAV